MDRANIESSLKRKGFIENNTKDHKYYHLKVGGIEVGVKTKTSRGRNHKRLDASLLSKMKKQLFLDKSSELRDLVNCPMSMDDYLRILRTKGIIS